MLSYSNRCRLLPRMVNHYPRFDLFCLTSITLFKPLHTQPSPICISTHSSLSFCAIIRPLLHVHHTWVQPISTIHISYYRLWAILDLHYLSWQNNMSHYYYTFLLPTDHLFCVLPPRPHNHDGFLQQIHTFFSAYI